MKVILYGLVKPRGIYAKILLLALLGGVLWLWTQGHFEILKTYTDTEQLTFTAGKFELSLYGAMKAILSIIVIFWTTAIVSDFSDKRIASLKSIRVTNKAIIQKALQIFIYFLALIITLNIIGIDLTSLTVLSGAVGIGLGFGMQKIAANFVSGIILLLERSIKIGDLLELDDGTFGYVRKSASRATTIETIDGQEVIIPNEDFIVKQVTNWTLSNPRTRVTINFGVSYGADIEKARELALTAVKEHKRCIEVPEAVCWLDNFGDSSVDFIMYFWVKDVNEGFRNVKSEVLFNIWNKFKENDIEIPFPQRDLHLRSATGIELMPQSPHKRKEDK